MRQEVKLSTKAYEKKLEELQMELVKLQRWVVEHGLRVIVIFEGRDAAGKGGTIKRIMQPLNPRHTRVAALPKPTETERSQWYFQRYVSHFPSAGEMVLFDRSWYNRAGVERVMEFCTDDEYWEFLNSVPEFENMIIRSGITLIKYWFSVSDEEQERRFQDRIDDPAKRWKLSDMDLEARKRWESYSEAKDIMFKYTDTTKSPWYVVESDIKKNARINCISHILKQIDYKEIDYKKIKLPDKKIIDSYERTPYSEQNLVEDVASKIASDKKKKKKKQGGS